MTAAVAVAAGAFTFAGPIPAAHTAPRGVIQQGMDRLVGVDRHPGALAAVRDRHGRTRHYTAGVGDLRTGGEVPTNGRVRIGSASKMFASVVVLQLVGEGRVELDAPIETYLPGLVRGKGIDATRITVRQLLQHDSGLPDYTDSMFKSAGDFLPYQHVYLEPRALLDLANARDDARAAGSGWSYSNTNYLLAGLIAQRVTGRPFDELVTTRVIQRAGLRDTYAPGVGEEEIRGRHPRGYQRDPATDELLDFTRMDPSWGWAAGHLISTPDDLNTFLRALLDGKLLKPAQLAQLRTTIPTRPGSDLGYGLGVFSTPLSCGGVAWGHGGDIPGYSTVDAATDDGRAATIVVTSLNGSVKDESVAADRAALLDTALCAN
ncbi:serine hydrolase domain-containing protein [Saccharothrix texasensis]|uniref:D-alanyl-D-alanine carboxypeptidase n=1 Tax=Saccharothrix texasensis TaxID=103734 RepID=A0A3N1H6Q8_9PSEU|nr:serine hydrolase domain-containing protein [Saccharothrix texasensis]ROP38200.1 D-alanyl-D-alanine carboxypeptidase [Saccharothrix texasensis]